MASKLAVDDNEWQEVFDSEHEMLEQVLGILRGALLERQLQDHAIYARVDHALSSGEIAEMRRVLEAWKSLPLRVRADLLRA